MSPGSAHKKSRHFKHIATSSDLKKRVESWILNEGVNYYTSASLDFFGENNSTQECGLNKQKANNGFN